jgi:hypothetical protein
MMKKVMIETIVQTRYLFERFFVHLYQQLMFDDY